MVTFNVLIERYDENAEKTGWTFFVVPPDIATKLKPGFRKSFRVKGKLDKLAIKGVSILPVGQGNFIMPLNQEMRKALKKRKGDQLKVQLEEDPEEKKISSELLDCLQFDPKALNAFQTMPASHQRYYSNWIESAKTEPTRAKRIAKTVKGLSLGMTFAEILKMEI